MANTGFDRGRPLSEDEIDQCAADPWAMLREKRGTALSQPINLAAAEER